MLLSCIHSETPVKSLVDARPRSQSPPHTIAHTSMCIAAACAEALKALEDNKEEIEAVKVIVFAAVYFVV